MTTFFCLQVGKAMDLQGQRTIGSNMGGLCMGRPEHCGKEGTTGFSFTSWFNIKQCGPRKGYLISMRAPDTTGVEISCDGESLLVSLIHLCLSS